jgi:hypothetical protein
MRTASFSLLVILCLMVAVAPAMAGTLYSNGAYNGTTDAWTINFGFTVSDSYSLSGGTSIPGMEIVYWDASSTDLLTTVDYQFGSSSFSGTTHTTAPVTNTFISTNQFGYNLYRADMAVSNADFTGANGFVTLGNACSTSGCSVSNPIYWDENSGPSLAYENTLGSIPSEAFTLNGCGGGLDCGPPVPEPSSILLFGSGILGLAGVLRRKLNR